MILKLVNYSYYNCCLYKCSWSVYLFRPSFLSLHLAVSEVVPEASILHKSEAIIRESVFVGP